MSDIADNPTEFHTRLECFYIINIYNVNPNWEMIVVQLSHLIVFTISFHFCNTACNYTRRPYSSGSKRLSTTAARARNETFINPEFQTDPADYSKKTKLAIADSGKLLKEARFVKLKEKKMCGTKEINKNVEQKTSKESNAKTKTAYEKNEAKKESKKQSNFEWHKVWDLFLLNCADHYGTGDR